MEVWPRIEAIVEAHGACALVSVVETRGSVPREAGARMIVRPDGAFHGSIGGGTLEWQALARAQAQIAAGKRAMTTIDQALGPDLGQCCGGRVKLAIELFDRTDLDEVRALAAAERIRPFAVQASAAGGRWKRRLLLEGQVPSTSGDVVEHYGEQPDTILLFGAGHVGRALVLALAPLPLRVVWNDFRPGAFPAAIPVNVEIAATPWTEVLANAPADSQVLVMTHSHALDLDIVASALKDPRFAHVGLIGSATKRARFARLLGDMAIPPDRIAALRCPIGIAGLGGKEPAVIAASVAAECLILREARSIKRETTAARRRPA